MNQINNNFKLLESFYFIFLFNNESNNIKRTFCKLIQADKLTMIYELTDLNQLNSYDSNIEIQEFKVTNKLHFDLMYKPNCKLYQLKEYYEAFHLIDKL